MNGIQKNIEELKAELNQAMEKQIQILEIIITITKAFPDVPPSARDWANHPATKHLNARMLEEVNKIKQLRKAIINLKAAQ